VPVWPGGTRRHFKSEHVFLRTRCSANVFRAPEDINKTGILMLRWPLALPSGPEGTKTYGERPGSGQSTRLTVTPASSGASWRLVLIHRRHARVYSGAATLSART